MEGKLTDISMSKLLEKFGAGNHKPGSGSASALQGMLSAKMLCTVVDLTCDQKRRSAYSAYIAELYRIKKEIDTRIYSKLFTLFEEDSKQFDRVIKLREARDIENDPQKKRELAESAKEALKASAELPVEIAKLCIELGEFATYVFDNGFKSARGDSGVALSSAVAGIASCLSIIDLNLISLPIDSRTKKIWQDKADIKLHHEKLSRKETESLNTLENEANEYKKYNLSLLKYREGGLAGSVGSNADIERIVRQLQNILWVHQDKIWKNEDLDNPLLLLKPDVVLKKVMEYAYSEPDSLGTYQQGNDRFEIAGLIDKSKRLVQVSKRFPKETRLFTAAHELGHAILHKRVVLHRDKPLDGSTSSPRNLEEQQADKFAAYFLMPTNQIKELFFEIFQMPRFIINENTVLAIRAKSISALRVKCENIRGLARLVASIDYYAGKTFNPMAKIFSVSIETLAIRLEELALVEF